MSYLNSSNSCQQPQDIPPQLPPRQHHHHHHLQQQQQQQNYSINLEKQLKQKFRNQTAIVADFPPPQSQTQQPALQQDEKKNKRNNMLMNEEEEEEQQQQQENEEDEQLQVENFNNDIPLENLKSPPPACFNINSQQQLIQNRTIDGAYTGNYATSNSSIKFKHRMRNEDANNHYQNPCSSSVDRINNRNDRVQVPAVLPAQPVHFYYYPPKLQKHRIYSADLRSDHHHGHHHANRLTYHNEQRRPFSDCQHRSYKNNNTNYDYENDLEEYYEDAEILYENSNGNRFVDVKEEENDNDNNYYYQYYDGNVGCSDNKGKYPIGITKYESQMIRNRSNRTHQANCNSSVFMTNKPDTSLCRRKSKSRQTIKTFYQPLPIEQEEEPPPSEQIRKESNYFHNNLMLMPKHYPIMHAHGDIINENNNNDNNNNNMKKKTNKNNGSAPVAAADDFDCLLDDCENKVLLNTPTNNNETENQEQHNGDTDDDDDDTLYSCDRKYFKNFAKFLKPKIPASIKARQAKMEQLAKNQAGSLLKPKMKESLDNLLNRLQKKDNNDANNNSINDNMQSVNHANNAKDQSINKETNTDNITACIPIDKKPKKKPKESTSLTTTATTTVCPKHSSTSTTTAAMKPLDDHCALDLHKSKSYIIDLIDRALSRELGTVPREPSFSPFAGNPRKAIDEIRRRHRSSSNANQKVCYELTDILTDSFVSNATAPTTTRTTTSANDNDNNKNTENKNNDVCQLLQSGDGENIKNCDPDYIKKLKKLRWGHIRHIQHEARRLADLEEFLETFGENDY